ncbi:hypothetical protein EVAR_71055_1 [Eumeta japonica]|uniref:Uncharacterized protein n=1 Tax=Eumeta variegata TaxID=151549 RepID=A0A4C1SID5_EUMVA|nr:hypothetical protein EVAR_71055_1 [Eumeta japonica]
MQLNSGQNLGSSPPTLWDNGIVEINARFLRESMTPTGLKPITVHMLEEIEELCEWKFLRPLSQPSGLDQGAQNKPRLA